MPREERGERTPRPGRGTPIGDAIFSLGRSYSDYCGLVQGGAMSAEDKAEEKKSLLRRAKNVLALIEAQ